MMRRGVLITLAMLAPGLAQAQRRDDMVPAGEPPLSVGGALQYARATGEFASYVRDGGGLTAHLGVRLGTDESPVSLRLGGQFLVYGSQTRRYPLVPGISVDVTTSNVIGGLTAGPQLTFGGRGIKAYVFGGVGFSYFATTSSVEGSNQNNSPFASSTNYEDVTFAGEAGGGLLIRLGGDAYLDVGARYLGNGRVTYVTKDGVTVSGNTLLVNPISSQANLAVYHVGISVGLRPRPGRGNDDDDDDRGRRRR